MVYYNDAAWLAQPGMALVHPSIDVDLAKAVGVQSLRSHHAIDSDVAENLPCPAAARLRESLNKMGVGPAGVITDLIEIANALACGS